MSGRATAAWSKQRPRVRRLAIKVRGRIAPRRWLRLTRTEPISQVYGWDRGTTLDRYYINRFVASHAERIRGDVLEVQSPLYITRHGGERVTGAHVLDINTDNSRATIFGDICDPTTLEGREFDCVILTQTLQYVRRPTAALAAVWRSLRPNGDLLISVPCITRLDPTAALEADYWRYTPAGLRAVLADSIPGVEPSIEWFGHVGVATAFLAGLPVEEVPRRLLEHDGREFPLSVCAHVRKTEGE